MAFPAHLCEELLALLPPDERPVYAERFEPIVGDLVWLREDAQNMLEQVLEESENLQVQAWKMDADTVRELTDALMEFENDALVGLIQDGLRDAARDLLRERVSRK